jgi:hypothetical protein
MSGFPGCCRCRRLPQTATAFARLSSRSCRHASTPGHCPRMAPRRAAAVAAASPPPRGFCVHTALFRRRARSSSAVHWMDSDGGSAPRSRGMPGMRRLAGRASRPDGPAGRTGQPAGRASRTDGLGPDGQGPGGPAGRPSRTGLVPRAARGASRPFRLFGSGAPTPLLSRAVP